MHGSEQEYRMYVQECYSKIFSSKDIIIILPALLRSKCRKVDDSTRNKVVKVLAWPTDFDVGGASGWGGFRENPYWGTTWQCIPDIPTGRSGPQCILLPALQMHTYNYVSIDIFVCCLYTRATRPSLNMSGILTPTMPYYGTYNQL